MELEIRQYLNELLRQHGLWDKGWRFGGFDRAKKRAGQCNFTSKVITLSQPLLVARGIEHTKETVRHEVAHALAGYQAKHNYIWKRCAIQVGAKPNRCFTADTVDSEKLKFKYTATCPSCKDQHGIARKLKRSYSCPKCSRGVYNPKFKLIITQNY